MTEGGEGIGAGDGSVNPLVTMGPSTMLFVTISGRFNGGKEGIGAVLVVSGTGAVEEVICTAAEGVSLEDNDDSTMCTTGDSGIGTSGMGAMGDSGTGATGMGTTGDTSDEMILMVSF